MTANTKIKVILGLVENLNKIFYEMFKFQLIGGTYINYTDNNWYIFSKTYHVDYFYIHLEDGRFIENTGTGKSKNIYIFKNILIVDRAEHKSNFVKNILVFDLNNYSGDREVLNNFLKQKLEA